MYTNNLRGKCNQVALRVNGFQKLRQETDDSLVTNLFCMYCSVCMSTVDEGEGFSGGAEEGTASCTA